MACFQQLHPSIHVERPYPVPASASVTPSDSTLLQAAASGCPTLTWFLLLSDLQQKLGDRQILPQGH